MGKPATITFAQEIIDALKVPFYINGVEVVVSGCIGMSMFPADGKDATTLPQALGVANWHS